MRPPTNAKKTTKPSGTRQPSWTQVLARKSIEGLDKRRDEALKKIIRKALGTRERLMFAPLSLQDNSVRVAVHMPDLTDEYDHIVMISNDHMHVLPMEPTLVRGLPSTLLFQEQRKAKLDICRNLQILHLCNISNEIARKHNLTELVENLNGVAAQIEQKMANGGNAWRPPCLIPLGKYPIPSPWCFPQRVSGRGRA